MATKKAARSEKTSQTNSRVQNVDPISQPTSAAMADFSDFPNLSEDHQPRLVRNNPIRVMQLQQMGYKPVKDDEGNNVVFQDTILMEIPNEIFEERQEHKNTRARDLVRIRSSQFLDAARAAGAEAEDTTTSRVGGKDDE